MNRLRAWFVASAIFAVTWTPASVAQTDTSCSLSGSSNADAVLSPPGGEDEDFLGRSGGGLPYIVFVIDTSARMRRFPYDLASVDVRAQGLGCANTLLNGLTYEANPCIDGKGQLVDYAAAACDPATLQPAGYGAAYQSSRRYAQFDPDLPNLFSNTSYYVHDRGWGQRSDRVDAAWTKSTPTEACAAAGLPAGDQAACALCLATKGYYLPQDPKLPPALSGNWINFNPPKYVIARKLLKDQFAALDAVSPTMPSRTRQAMLTVVDTPKERCFSKRLDNKGMDATADGATLLGMPTKFKPPCGQFLSCVHNGSQGGGRAAFDNQVNKEQELFTSPLDRCPTGIDVPSEAPLGTTAVSLTPGPDGVCNGAFVNSANVSLGEAVCAPYAESLLNAGQYLADLGLYDRLFTSKPPGTWRKSEFDVNTTDNPSVCPALSCGCPRPTIILLAAGAPGFDDNLPCEVTGDGCAELTPPTACEAKEPSATSKLAKVARFLARANIKPNEFYSSPAHVYTHVVGFGTDNPDLIEAARAGKGKFFSAYTASQLRAALNEAIGAASVTEYSFSNASVASVQTRTSSGLLVPRFTPTDKSAFWSGRLYQFQLVNEDTCGCREPVATNDPCDFNKDGRCGGGFFKDADGDFIAADANGVFRKATLVGAEFRPGIKEARPLWEAADKLAARSSRKVMTVVDSNGDGVLDHRDDVVAFDETNAALLLPYLNLSASGTCSELGNRLGMCLTPLDCATLLIGYVRGNDLLDEDCDGDRDEPRAAQLADIFHSSPTLVDPPLRATSMLCRMGLANQCVISLVATPTPLNPPSAFDDFVQAHQRRDKVVLVGTNDGMLHAFRGGRWIGADNPETKATNECPSATDCTGYYDLGDGEELWAFIPPDLLPKLSRLLSSQHQYFVDGSAMVREIWADDDGNARKEPTEFHTVAVVGERRGGDHFFALDLTDPSGPATLPATGFFRWTYPQPNTVAARNAGQSYADFAPSPPPIGPVRIKTSGAATGTYLGSPYEERWVVLLNGGFDPAQLRGHSVSMVDVWRGGDGTDARRSLWTFDTGQGRYSFAATPAMVGFGAASTNPNRAVNEYFFDTATIGDVGGQLWALRFNDPDPAKWSGGRIFSSTKVGATCARQPFFQITSNTIATQGGHLRTLAGTGDRSSFADMQGGRCSANDLTGCLRRGCTLVQKVTRTSCGKTSTFQRTYGGPNGATACELADVITLDASSGTNCCATTVEARADYTLSCTNTDGTPVTIRWQPNLTCLATSATTCGVSDTQFACTATNDTPFDICSTFDRCDAPIDPPSSGFYAVKVFDDLKPGRAVFDSPTAATAFDGAALTTADLVQVDPYTPSTVQAAATDSGWYVHYSPDHVFPPLPVPFTGTAKNERTASAATVVGGCAVFNTTTPGRAAGACMPRAMSATTTYALNFLSGGACTGVDAALSGRVAYRLDSEPPSPAALAFELTPSGSINIQLTGISRSSGGAAQTTPVFSDLELIKTSYRLPVSRPIHACRHPEGTTVEEQRANARAACELR